MEIEEIATQIVDSAYRVHVSLGPGLLESAYQACISYEIRSRGLNVECEVPIPVIYNGVRLDTGYRIDLRIENCILIENKTVEILQPIHEAQMMTYLRLGGYHLGFLINWNVRLFKQGIRRIVYELPEPKCQIDNRNKA